MINLVQNGVIVCMLMHAAIFTCPLLANTNLLLSGFGIFCLCFMNCCFHFSSHRLCQERCRVAHKISNDFNTALHITFFHITKYGWFWNSLEFFFAFNYQEFSALVLISKKGPKCTNKKWVPLYPGLGRP